MKSIGLKYIVAALLDETGEMPEYTDGLVVGKAISAKIGINTADATLYADDSVSDKINEFTDGSLDLSTDDLTYEVQNFLLGHTVTTETSQTLTANSNDVSPYVGVGFYAPVMRNGAKKFRAVWIYKVVFKEFSDELATKADKVSFQTPSISGAFMPLQNGDWKTETILNTEEAAKLWLNDMASIGGGE